MKTARKTLGAVLCGLSWLIAAAPASGTMVVERNFSDLVHRAEVILVGTVSDIREEWDAARQVPFTLVTFSDLTMLKGPSGMREVTLYFFGGTAPDGTVLSVAGIPQFTVGEKNVVFCAGNHHTFCPLVGIWQGLLRVAYDPQRGMETVRDNFHVPILSVQDGQFRRLTPLTAGQAPLSLPTLIQHIQQELRSDYGQP